MRSLFIFAVSAWVLVACSTEPMTEKNTVAPFQQRLVVCPETEIGGDCDFSGQEAIQEAVDAAQTGATILIREGTYQPSAHRDIPFQQLLIRGFTVIENKDLTLRGEGKVILDGSRGAASAFVTKNSNLRFENMELHDFRWGIEEDDTYDGHGIFVIGGNVSIDNVVMRKIQKMGLTVRESARVDVNNLDIRESHLGVWSNENSIVNIQNSTFHGSESCGLGAYDRSKVYVNNSVFDSNQSDGVYASDEAQVIVTSTIAVNNKPFGVSVDEQAKIRIDNSYVSDNEKNFSDASSPSQISIGEGMLTSDPRKSVR